MNEPWHKVERSGSPTVYETERWQPLFDGLVMGFSSRHGGKSEAHYQSLNCGLHVGDCPEDVIQNRQRLATTTPIAWEGWTYAEQVHGDRVAVIMGEEKGYGRQSREQALQDTDAMVTNVSGISLTLLFADCVPIYFMDPVRRIVAIAHAGWRGTVQQIAANTIRHMVQIYHSHPDDIRAMTGPSIQQCCYEVDDKVISQVDAIVSKLSIRTPVYIPTVDGRYKLDLHQLNRQIMIKAGILPFHIEITNLCTACNTDTFFSHRAENGATGRMAAWIAIGD